MKVRLSDFHLPTDRVYLFFYFLISGRMGCTGAYSKCLRLLDDDSFP
jgi:hypothetical protein